MLVFTLVSPSTPPSFVGNAAAPKMQLAVSTAGGANNYSNRPKAKFKLMKANGGPRRRPLQRDRQQACNGGTLGANSALGARS
jgi:hypothetical protein